MGFDIWTHGKPRRFLSDSYWRQPHRWNAQAAREGRRARVFCASMADVFEWKRGLTPWRDRLWHLIDDTPELDWLLLTKRPHLVRRLTPWEGDWPDNVWVGTTTENQRWADRRLNHLREIPASVRFVSCEPLLGGIDLDTWLSNGAVHWVIAGGESGPQARPSDPAWFLDLLAQCQRHEVPFHFKQWGEWAPVDDIKAVPRSILNDGTFSEPLGRFGKKASGRTLAGETWDEAPLQESQLDAPARRESATTPRALDFHPALAFQGR